MPVISSVTNSITTPITHSRANPITSMLLPCLGPLSLKYTDFNRRGIKKKANKGNVKESEVEQNVVKKNAQTKNTVISLKPLTAQHAPYLLNLLTAQICSSLAIEPVKDLSQAVAFVHGEGLNQNKRFGIFYHCADVAPVLIGSLAYLLENKVESELSSPSQVSSDNWASSHCQATISYWLGHSYQRQGFAGKALRLLLNSLISQDVEHVLANVYVDNISSQKLLTTLGFIPQDTFRQSNANNHYFADNTADSTSSKAIISFLLAL